jgi:putative effector of murein hydrolase LrgA (UPF0299 family)
VKISEEAVFRWVVIVLIAAVSVILVTVAAGSLAGAIWGLVLLCAAGWHGYRWSVRKWRDS